MRNDGSITSWGVINNAPVGNFTNIFATDTAFAGLKTDGTIVSWGDSRYGGANAPSGTFQNIYATREAFAGLKTDGTVATWGNPLYGGSSTSGTKTIDGVGYNYTGVSPQSVFKEIYSNEYAFAGLKEDGSIESWGWDSR